MDSQRCRLRRWMAVLAVVAGVPTVAAAGLETKGKVDAVTVYRGQALVTRLVEVPGPPGLREVVVTGLPDRVVPGSIYAESADGVVVRSVRYRVRPVSQDVRQEVREIDARMEEIREQIDTTRRHVELAAEHAAYLDQLEQFTAPTANVELSKGVLDAGTLKDLTVFLFEQRSRLAEDELRLAREEKALDEKLDLLQRQRNELTGGSARTVREAVVFVDLKPGGGGLLRLRYLVEQATWTPSYNVRTDADRSQVVVEYNASIQQMSGEDWSDVAMTLSTATPSLAASAPPLEPLKVTLASPPAVQAAGKGGAGQMRQELRRKQRQLERDRNALAMEGRRGGQQAQQAEEQFLLDNREFDEALNRTAGDLQLLDLTARGRVKRKAALRRESDRGVSVTYALEGRTALPSRSDRQLIQIASLPMEAEFYKVVTPVLTEYAYDEARVLNTSNLVLLAGPASAFVGGQFMGHGQVPTVAAGEGFTMGFGIDSSLRASRQLVERKESIQGGNRVVDFTYRLSVENFGEVPAAVRLMDRLPVARAADVKVTLGATDVEPSRDREYRKTGRPAGILRWDTEVPPQAIGTEALAIEYQFRLEYDREMSITGLAAAGR